MRRLGAFLILLAVGVGAYFATGQILSAPVRADGARTAAPALGGSGIAGPSVAARLDRRDDAIAVRFRRRPPRAGLLFDLDSGRVLWRRNPTRVRAIASLTKMMTALVVSERVPPDGRARITPETLRYRGSGVGLLPRGRLVPVDTLLYGLLLASGNDAAIALAQRAGDGEVRNFVALMNERARAMGLSCTRFSSPSGIRDADRSCAADLATLARAVLANPRLAPIVARRRAILPFPIRGGRLHLNNTNPLLRSRYPGTTGVKTGFTEAAGRSLVASVTRDGRRLAVVLLDSRNPGRDARALFDAGFARP